MDVNERFLAASNVWRRYGILFKMLVKNYGFETALELHLEARSEVDEKAMNNFRLKRMNLNDDQFRGFIEEAFNSSGYDSKASIKNDAVEIKITRCPYYTGFTNAGIEHDATLAVCGSGCERRARNYPMYLGVIEHKETAEGYCVEGFRL